MFFLRLIGRLCLMHNPRQKKQKKVAGTDSIRFETRMSPFARAWVGEQAAEKIISVCPAV